VKDKVTQARVSKLEENHRLKVQRTNGHISIRSSIFFHAVLP
jgi:hypothetical protein